MIEIKDAVYEYENNGEKTEALSSLSVTVADGEFWGIIGHTGSGKSTLTEVMAGLLKVKSGVVIVGGIDVNKEKNTVRALRGKVGLVFQYPEHQLFEETVLRDVMFGPKNMGFDEEECKKRAREALRMLSIGEEYENLSPFELSGGEKRRVAIAGVLAMKPEVLILDEPTAGLDPAGRSRLLETLRSTMGQEVKSIVLVSHSMEDVCSCADKVLVMKNGKAVLCGETGYVFSQYDVLEDAGVDTTQINRLMKKLNDKGHCFSEAILTVEDAAREIYDRLRGEGKC